MQLLAIRDELVSRDFDPPAAWWPAQPTVIGGRDRTAGGTWCASDVPSGVTALVLNRVERRTGTPSRGVLPLAAVASGEAWPSNVDHREMASFNLVLAGPSGVTAWTWDARSLERVELGSGTHMITSAGVDSDDAKTNRYAPQFAARPWSEVVTAEQPEDDLTALVVRHPVDNEVYATVFGQLITAAPGSLQVSSSRTPWVAGSWTEQRWP